MGRGQRIAKDQVEPGDVISIDREMFEQYAVHLPKELVKELLRKPQLPKPVAEEFARKRHLPVVIGIRFSQEATEAIDKDRKQGLFPRSRAEYIRDAVNEYYMRRTGKLK